MTYAGSGVDYGSLDPFKVAAMKAAESTAHQMGKSGFVEIPWSRGESAYLYQHRTTNIILAFVIEGLGTKNKIAEDIDLRKACGDATFYRSIAQCNAAMTFNDMITVGAMPTVFGLHVAVSDGNHLAGKNGVDLIEGTQHACELAGCTFGPGETPALSNVIEPGTMCLSGSASGIVMHENLLQSPLAVRPGLQIVMLDSSGVHSNGITLTRRIAAEKLSRGYLTKLPSGQMYGEALLTPTTSYVNFVRHCQLRNKKISYAVNITGHGWRKLMRASIELSYVINNVPEVPEIFKFIMDNGPVKLSEMYGNYNMGAGFAVYVEAEDVHDVIAIAREVGIGAWHAGEIIEGPRQVVIKPHQLTFSDLKLR